MTYCYRQGKFWMDTDAGANLRWHNISERLPTIYLFYNMTLCLISPVDAALIMLVVSLVGSSHTIALRF